MIKEVSTDQSRKTRSWARPSTIAEIKYVKPSGKKQNEKKITLD